MSPQSVDTHNKSIMLPGHDFETIFMLVPVNAHACVWVILVVFLECLATDSMSDTLLNISRAIKSRKRWGKQIFVESSMETRDWKAWSKPRRNHNYTSWSHLKGYHLSSGPGGAFSTGVEWEKAQLSRELPGDVLQETRVQNLSVRGLWRPWRAALLSKWTVFFAWI